MSLWEWSGGRSVKIREGVAWTERRYLLTGFVVTHVSLFILRVDVGGTIGRELGYIFSVWFLMLFTK